MSTSQPLVSVLMPAYRHEGFVEQAMRSVFAQTWPNMELIVVDDVSPDRTYEVAQAVAASTSVPVTVMRNAQNRGITGTLEEALRHARGEYVCILASDDFYHPDFVATCMGVFQDGKDPMRTVVHTDAFIVDEAGDVKGSHRTISGKKPLVGNSFWELVYPTPNELVAIAVCFSTQLLREVGGFDARLKYEDFDLHLRLSRRAQHHYIERPLVYKRIVPRSLGGRPWVWAEDIFTALEKHRDLIGDKAQEIYPVRMQRIALSCLQAGGFSQGLAWRKRSRAADPAGRHIDGTVRFGVKAAKAYARYVAVKYLPFALVDRVRQLKRRDSGPTQHA